MKALVYEGPWQMPLRQIEDPIPTPNDVIVSVQSVGICGSDVHGFMGTTGRRKPPIVMGHEFSGVITTTGDAVADYKVGDRVVGQPLLVCGTCDNCRAGLWNICLNRSGLGINLNGAYAESVGVPQQMLYRLPAEMSWEQGATVEPLAVAMHAVNLTPIKLMESVVIIGAGTIGLLTLLAVRLKGAGRVIVTDLSPHRLQTARRLGADVVVNVSEQDPVEVVYEHTNHRGADTVIEAVGITATVKQSLAVVRMGGHVTWIGNSQPEVELNMQQVVTREVTIAGAYGFNVEFEQSIEAIQSGRIDTTRLIEKTASLEDGPQLFNELASNKLDAIKIILKPHETG
jgi:L-iditol 2-dehydrogenase